MHLAAAIDSDHGVRHGQIVQRHRMELVHMEKLRRVARVAAVLAIPAGILLVSLGNHVHGL